MRGPEVNMNSQGGSRSGTVLAVEEVTRDLGREVMNEMTSVRGVREFRSKCLLD